MYTYTHMHITMYTYAHMHIYIQTNLHTHTLTHTHTRTHTYTHTHTLTFTHSHLYSHTHLNPHTRTHTHIYTGLLIHRHTSGGLWVLLWVCQWRMHSLAPSHAHTFDASHHHTVSATIAASGCRAATGASNSATTTSSPALFLTAKCKGRMPSCATTDSRQRQHTAHEGVDKTAKRPCAAAWSSTLNLRCVPRFGASVCRRRCTGIWVCADTKYAICQKFQHAHLLGLASTGHFPAIVSLPASYSSLLPFAAQHQKPKKKQKN